MQRQHRDDLNLLATGRPPCIIRRPGNPGFRVIRLGESHGSRSGLVAAGDEDFQLADHLRADGGRRGLAWSGIVGHLAQAVDVHVPAHPLRHRELRRGSQRPVRDQAAVVS